MLTYHFVLLSNPIIPVEWLQIYDNFSFPPNFFLQKCSGVRAFVLMRLCLGRAVSISCSFFTLHLAWDEMHLLFGLLA